jgi:hypothetical protein
LHANHIMMWVDANTTNLQILNSTYIVTNFINFFDVKICYFFCISITLIIVHLLEFLVLSFCNICICYFIPLLIETTNNVFKITDFSHIRNTDLNALEHKSQVLLCEFFFVLSPFS